MTLAFKLWLSSLGLFLSQLALLIGLGFVLKGETLTVTIAAVFLPLAPTALFAVLAPRELRVAAIGAMSHWGGMLAGVPIGMQNPDALLSHAVTPALGIVLALYVLFAGVFGGMLVWLATDETGGKSQTFRRFLGAWGLIGLIALPYVWTSGIGRPASTT